MEEDISTDSPMANTPMTEDQIIAATVGERHPLNSTIYLAPYDPAWTSLFTQLKKHIHEALGDDLLLLEHVGSTSVPGLSAKPIIDMVLAAPDSSDELSYVKPLEEKGYTLWGREPDWYEHRLLKAPDVCKEIRMSSLMGVKKSSRCCCSVTGCGIMLTIDCSTKTQSANWQPEPGSTHRTMRTLRPR